MTDAEPTALPSALKTDVTDARPLKLNVDVTEKTLAIIVANSEEKPIKKFEELKAVCMAHGAKGVITKLTNSVDMVICFPTEIALDQGQKKKLELFKSKPEKASIPIVDEFKNLVPCDAKIFSHEPSHKRERHDRKAKEHTAATPPVKVAAPTVGSSKMKKAKLEEKEVQPQATPGPISKAETTAEEEKPLGIVISTPPPSMQQEFSSTGNVIEEFDQGVVESYSQGVDE